MADFFTTEKGRGGLTIRYNDLTREITLDRSGLNITFGDEGDTSRTRLLENGEIRYVKWDANRHIADLYSARMSEGTVQIEPSGMILHKYVLGLYRILEQLRQRYPDLLIEGCCGGGGSLYCVTHPANAAADNETISIFFMVFS